MLEQDALDAAVAFAGSTDKKTRLATLAAACVQAVEQTISEPVQTPENYTWRRIPTPAGWPATVCIVRGSALRNGVPHFGIGGLQAQDGQIWYINASGNLSKYSHFDAFRVNCLLDNGGGTLYCGRGIQHVAGSANVGYYDNNGIPGNWTGMGQGTFTQDIIYSLVKFDGVLYCGTMAEDIAGSMRVKKWIPASSSWVDVFSPNLNGAPASYTYTAAYCMAEFNGMLHAGMNSRTGGHGHVWRLTAAGWVNLGNPFSASQYTLDMIEFEGSLVAAFSTDGANHPVRKYNEATQIWENVGNNTPAAWGGATIFNHMCIDAQGRLLVGVGGSPGHLSVWRLDAGTWIRIAGAGVNGSWTAPLGTAGKSEWIYRLIMSPNGTIYAGVSSDAPNGSCSIWELKQT